MTLKYRLILILLSISLLVNIFKCDYIRSNEIILNDGMEIGSELVNLNKLMSLEKQRDLKKDYIFNLVNDSFLINYVELRISNSQILIVLKKKIVYDDICVANTGISNEINLPEYISCTQSIKIIAVNENDFIEIPVEMRKSIIGRKKNSNKISLDLIFKKSQDSIFLNVTSVLTNFKLEPAIFATSDNSSSFVLNDFEINYKLEDDLHFLNKDYFEISIEKGPRLLNLKIEFKNKKALEKALNLNKIFNFKLNAYLSKLTNNADDIYELKTNASLNIVMRVGHLKQMENLKMKGKNEKTNLESPVSSNKLKPLDFESSIYTVIVNLNDLVIQKNSDILIQPKLKGISDQDLLKNKILFTILENEPSNTDLVSHNNQVFPFILNDSNGSIKFNRDEWINSLDNDDTSINQNERFYSFGIKATYKSLSQVEKNINIKNGTTSYYFDYLIPAFAKIEISFRKDAEVKAPIIKSEIITPIISKYEILNEESTNQTLVLYINDPLQINSKLLKIFIESENLSDINAVNLTEMVSQNNKRKLDWQLSDENLFKFEKKNNSGQFQQDELSDLIIINKCDFKDQNVYKTSIKIFEIINKQTNLKKDHTDEISMMKRKTSTTRFLSEINLEFRIDFDPLLFEKNEYNLQLTQYDLLNQDLIRLIIKQRTNNNNINKKLNQYDYSKNILFRLVSSTSPSIETTNANRRSLLTSNENDDEYFEINPSTGWLSVKKLLTNKFFYEFTAIGWSNELQKSAQAKVKVHVDCLKPPTSNNNTSLKKLKFSLFENSPNRTQIGNFKSVCSNSNYFYDLDQTSMILKTCAVLNNYSQFKNCTLFRFEFSKLLTTNNNSIGHVTNKLFDVDLNGYLMTNYLISSAFLINLIQQQQDDNVLSEFLLDNDQKADASIYDLNKTYSIQFNASFTNMKNKFNFDIEILMKNMPKLINFDDNIFVTTENNNEVMPKSLKLKDSKINSNIINQDIEINDVLNSNKDNCIYNYKFLIDQNPKSNVLTIHRFVRVDSNSQAHLEALFKTSSSDCFGWFFIHNNGCLTIKYDHLYKYIESNENDSNKCQLQYKTNDTNDRDFLILKSGNYNIEFKLCFYDNNKVSCSQFYNQKIIIAKDLYKSSKYLIKSHRDNDKSESLLDYVGGDMPYLSSPSQLSRQMNSTKPSFTFLGDSNKSFYLLILVAVILGIALVLIITFTILFVVYAKPNLEKRKNSKLNNNRDNLVVTSKNDTFFNESDSKLTTNLNTPETSSNAATTSSKLSKTDDENDDIKIHVSDDCQSISKSTDQMKYGYASNNSNVNNANQNINKNINYAGSFSSLNTSSRDSAAAMEDMRDNIIKSIKVTDNIDTNHTNIDNKSFFENEQGLYSVKNASIQFNIMNSTTNSCANIHNSNNPHKNDLLNNNNSSSLLIKTYDNVLSDYNFMESNSNSNSTISNNYYTANVKNNMDLYNNNNNNNSNSIQNSPLNMNNLVSNQPQNKVNSLKKLKNNSAVKKAVANSQLNQNINEYSNNNNIVNYTTTANKINHDCGIKPWYHDRNLVQSNNTDDIVASVV